jgi:GNAT superfamily N-acetyltransferase
MEVQTNNTLLAVMMQTFACDIGCEKIVFEDQLTTTLSAAGAGFRRGDDDDRAKMFSHQYEPQGDWVVEVNGAVVASGGIMYHYNRPYGDLYMEVAEPFRRRGLGSFLVQELKRVCYEGGSVPCARCDPTNVASRETLQKAGFVPCGEILYGTLPARTKD